MATTRKLLPTERLQAALANALQRHTSPGQKLVLGLSGGIDSVVLLHALQHPHFAIYQLGCVHVHHGLSPYADAWAGFCAQLCERLHLPLAVHRVHVDRNDPAGIESAARTARREIFAQLDANLVLTAHHQDDQAETVLLQLLRGAGPKGLAAMAELQRHPNWKALQLRPWLDVTRAQIEHYAREHALTWITDESNRDRAYSRNYLRHEVMPAFSQRFPATVPVLARAARLQAEALAVLNDMARLDAQSCMQGDHLDCACLAQCSLPRARNLLRWFIEHQGCRMPSERRLDEGLRQLLCAAPDAQVCVKITPEVELRRYRGAGYLVPIKQCADQPTVTWRGEAQIHLEQAHCYVVMTPAQGAGLRATRLRQGHVQVGVRRGGENLKTSQKGPHRSLKNLLQEAQIPPWQRACVPVLWCDGQLAWVSGIGIHVDFLASPDEAGIVPVNNKLTMRPLMSDSEAAS